MLGLVALMLSWLSVLNVPVIILGVVFSALGLKAARRGGAHRGLARWGLGLAILALVTTAGFTAFVVQRVNSCTDTYGEGTSQYDDCVRFQRSP